MLGLLEELKLRTPYLHMKLAHLLSISAVDIFYIFPTVQAFIFQRSVKQSIGTDCPTGATLISSLRSYLSSSLSTCQLNASFFVLIGVKPLTRHLIFEIITLIQARISVKCLVLCSHRYKTSDSSSNI